MKVHMRTTAIGPGRHHIAGGVYDVSDDVAQDYIAGGYATSLEPVAETATHGPRENMDARPVRRGAREK